MPSVPATAVSDSCYATAPLQGLLDSWLGLWQLVFQPAIGVLMLGAVSAVAELLQAFGRGSL